MLCSKKLFLLQFLSVLFVLFLHRDRVLFVMSFRVIPTYVVVFRELCSLTAVFPGYPYIYNIYIVLFVYHLHLYLFFHMSMSINFPPLFARKTFIAKTYLFKYTENFTTKKCDAVLTCTHICVFEQK